jgi:aminobenzoyl-glutamate transport protein
MLDGIERLGNKVPNPVLMFLYLIILVIALSSILALAGVSVTETVVEPVSYATTPNHYEDTTQPRSLCLPRATSISSSPSMPW